MTNFSTLASSPVDASNLTTFDIDDFSIGARLGSGSFSSVYVVSRKNAGKDIAAGGFFETDHTTCHSMSSSDASLLTFSTELDDCHYSRHHHGTLAIKMLHRKIFHNDKKAKYAVLDMQNEVHVLSTLPRQHPNIIALKGISTDFWSKPKNAFLVLERLHEPLDKAILRWKDEATALSALPSNGLGIKGLFRKRHLSRQAQARRIQQAALGVARALEFLHSERIIFRDLKPANLGLDKRGQVKMFDFALAQRLEKDQTLTKHVGTLRYMAPEVATSQDYDLSADVYSFGMVLWELCTLEKPYDSAQDKIVLGLMVADPTLHPPLRPRIASKAMRDLLKDCWAEKRQERPCFETIVNELEDEVGHYIAKQTSNRSLMEKQASSKKGLIATR